MKNKKAPNFEHITKKLTKIMNGIEFDNDCGSIFDDVQRYMDEVGIKPLAQGSSRMTYRLNKDYVLKVAINYIGVAQNKTEAHYFNNVKNPLFNKNISCSKKGYWIIAEYAGPVTSKKIEELFGCTKGQLDSMITYALTKHARNKTILELYKTKFHNHKFFKALRQLPKLGLIADDYSSFYSENYGISKKGLVLLDGGLTNETAQLYY